MTDHVHTFTQSDRSLAASNGKKAAITGAANGSGRQAATSNADNGNGGQEHSGLLDDGYASSEESEEGQDVELKCPICLVCGIPMTTLHYIAAVLDVWLLMPSYPLCVLVPLCLYVCVCVCLCTCRLMASHLTELVLPSDWSVMWPHVLRALPAHDC